MLWWSLEIDKKSWCLNTVLAITELEHGPWREENVEQMPILTELWKAEKKNLSLKRLRVKSVDWSLSKKAFIYLCRTDTEVMRPTFSAPNSSKITVAINYPSLLTDKKKIEEKSK